MWYLKPTETHSSEEIVWNIEWLIIYTVSYYPVLFLGGFNITTDCLVMCLSLDPWALWRWEMCMSYIAASPVPTGEDPDL